MRDHSQDQVFTVFGGAYVAEHHEFNQPACERATRSGGKIAAVAGILLLAITTATAMKANRALEGASADRAGVNWALAGFEDALY